MTRRTEPSGATVNSSHRASGNEATAPSSDQARCVSYDNSGRDPQSLGNADMNVFKDTLLSQMKSVLDRMTLFDSKLQQLGSTVGTISQQNTQQAATAPRNFLPIAQHPQYPAHHHQLYYPPLYPSSAANLAPLGRQLPQPGY